MTTRRHIRGVTLIEAVVAMAVLGVAIPPLVRLYGEVATHSANDTNQVMALAYAESLMEEIVSRAFEDPDEATGSFGGEEGTRTAFDDIDDYDGLSNSPPLRLDGTALDDHAGFTRSATIDNVTAADPDPTTAEADGSTDYKRIRVTVAWTTAEGGEVTLTTQRTRLLGSDAPGSVSATPIAHWMLDETSGTTSAEEVASNDGTYVNGVVLGQAGAPAGGTSVRFDGSNDHVEIPHSDDYLLDGGTIQLWFNADDTSGTQTLISKDSTGFDTGGHVRIYLSGDDVEVRLQSTAVSYYVDASNLVSAGQWYHVAFTFGSGGMKVYVNGIIRDTHSYTGGLGTTSGGIGNHEPMVLGADTYNSDDLVVTPLQHYFDGRIDAVAIYDEQLPAADILTLYENGGTIE